MRADLHPFADHDVERLSRSSARFDRLRWRNRRLWLKLRRLQDSPHDADAGVRTLLTVERLDVLDEMGAMLSGSPTQGVPAPPTPR